MHLNIRIFPHHRPEMLYFLIISEIILAQIVFLNNTIRVDVAVWPVVRPKVKSRHK